jgi:hypothetical protein
MKRDDTLYEEAQQVHGLLIGFGGLLLGNLASYPPFDHKFSKFDTPINGITYLGTWVGGLMPSHVIHA